MTMNCLKTSRRAYYIGKWLIVQDSGECQVSTRWEKISYTQIIIYLYIYISFHFLWISFIFFSYIVFFPILSNIHLCEWIVDRSCVYRWGYTEVILRPRWGHIEIPQKEIRSQVLQYAVHRNCCRNHSRIY